MKRFHFPLQTVHNLREMRLEEAERVLAEAITKVAEARISLDELVRTREKATDEYSSKISSGVIDPYEMMMTISYLDQLSLKECEARARLATLEKECDARRFAVTEAAKEAEATAKLRERHHKRYKAEQARSEQEMLDEMATIASNRRLRGL
jgi:flagellar export protein FliJ